MRVRASALVVILLMCASVSLPVPVARAAGSPPPNTVSKIAIPMVTVPHARTPGVAAPNSPTSTACGFTYLYGTIGLYSGAHVHYRIGYSNLNFNPISVQTEVTAVNTSNNMSDYVIFNESSFSRTWERSGGLWTDKGNNILSAHIHVTGLFADCDSPNLTGGFFVYGPAAAYPGAEDLPTGNLNEIGVNANFPTCWTGVSHGTNTQSWAFVLDPVDNTPAVQLTITSLTNGDAELAVPLAANCAPVVTVAHPYTLTVSYSSTAPVFWILYTRDAAGTWSPWIQSPTFPATRLWFAPALASTWSSATWVSPPIPYGVTDLSLGLALNTVGSLTTDNYSLIDSTTVPHGPAWHSDVP